MTKPITGLKALDRKLQRIAKRDGSRIGRNAVNSGLTIARKGIASEVPVGATKRLKKSVGKRFKKNRHTHLIEAKAGTNVAKKKPAQAFHGHLVAAGTTTRTSDKTGANRGRVEPNDFVARGWNKVRGQVLPAMKRKLSEGIGKLRK